MGGRGEVGDRAGHGQSEIFAAPDAGWAPLLLLKLPRGYTHHQRRTVV